LQTHAPPLQTCPSAQVEQLPPFFPQAVSEIVVMQPPLLSQQPFAHEVLSQALAPPEPLPPEPLAPPDPFAPPEPLAPPEAPPDPFAPPEALPPEPFAPPEALPPEPLVPPELPLPPEPLVPPELPLPPEPFVPPELALPPLPPLPPVGPEPPVPLSIGPVVGLTQAPPSRGPSETNSNSKSERGRMRSSRRGENGSISGKRPVGLRFRRPFVARRFRVGK
jgi:homeobox protein ESX1